MISETFSKAVQQENNHNEYKYNERKNKCGKHLVNLGEDKMYHFGNFLVGFKCFKIKIWRENNLDSDTNIEFLKTEITA